MGLGLCKISTDAENYNKQNHKLKNNANKASVFENIYSIIIWFNSSIFRLEIYK